MASNIKFKRSAVQNRVPTTAQLDLGELALNTYDGKLYTEINTGSATVIEIGSKLSSLVVDGDNGAGGGDVTFHGTTAGKDLIWDYSANKLVLNDNTTLQFGTTSGDSQFFHSGGDLHLFNNVGNTFVKSSSVYNIQAGHIRFRNHANNEDMANFFQNGRVDLHFDNQERLRTTVDGVDIGGTGSLKVPVGTTAQRNSSPVAGDIRYNTTTGGFEGYSSSWGELGGGGIGIGSTSTNPASGVVANRIGVGFTDINVVGSGISVTGYGSTIVLDFNDFKPGSFHRSIHNYTATAGQTTFAGLNYVTSEKQIAVYLNGARLSEATYTATSGTTVVLDVGASLGDEVEIINIHTNSDVDRKVNTYTATAGQTTFTGLSYNSKQELDVYLNGIRLASADYTATSGNTVVLAVGASVNDTVDIVSTGDGITWRSTTDASGDRFTLTNVGIGTDQTPDKLNVRGNSSFVGVTTFTGDVATSGQILSTYNHASNPRIHLSGISGSSGYNYLLRGDNDAGSRAVHFVNGSARSADNGANTYTIRNDHGKLHLGKTNQLAVLQGSTTYLQHGSSTRLNTTSTGITASGTQHIFTSGTSGDCTVIIESDTDNNPGDENENPKLVFRQDGGIEEAAIGMNLTNVNANAANEFFIASGINEGAIVLATTSTNGYTNAIERLRITPTGNIRIPVDSGSSTVGRLQIGASQDLEIYHDSFNSIIEDSGSGNLMLKSNMIVGRSTADENLFKAFENGAVELYHNNVKRFETTSTGASVTGNLNVSGVLTYDDVTNIDSVGIITARSGLFAPDNASLKLGNTAASPDLEILHNASENHFLFNQNTFFKGNLAWGVRNASNQNILQVDGSARTVELYGGGVRVVSTASAKLTVRGGIEIENSEFNMTTNGNKILDFETGGSNHVNFRHNPSDSSITTFMKAIHGGGVELYHDSTGVKKFETTSNGVNVTGRIFCDGTAANSRGLIFNDSVKISLGSNNDLEIYHDGSHSYIDDVGTGNLKVRSNNFRVSNADESKLSATFQPAGAVELYHNNVKMLETTAIGLTISGDVKIIDGENLRLGDSNDLIIYHTGSHSFIDHSGAGNLYIRTLGTDEDLTIQAQNDVFIKCANGEDGIRVVGDGEVKLYHNSNEKLATTSSGINVTGSISVSGTVDGRDLQTDGAKLDGIAAGATNVTNTNQLTNGAGFLTSVGTSNISNNAVTLAKMQQIGSPSFLGRNSSGTGNVQNLSVSDVRTMLNVENGATADQSASEILTLIKTVDGAGSGLDADTLDGVQASGLVAVGGDTMTGNLRIDKSSTVDGLIGEAYGGFFGLKHTDQSLNSEYMILSQNSDTYISASTGSDVYIRAGGNSSTNQLIVGSGNDALTWRGNKVWHAGNDGSGSGLDADTLDGAQPSVSAGNNTIVKRHSSGYIFANYFNTTPNDIATGSITKICAESSNDGYIRHASAAAVRSFLGLASSATTDTTNASNISSGTIAAARFGSASARESGVSAAGNFGQFEPHGTYTNANTEPNFWGWNFSTGTSNFPNSTSTQWYRCRVSLGSDYGKGTNAGDYSMELCYPRNNRESAGQMWTRTIENGSEQSWLEVGSRPYNSIIPRQNNQIDLGSSGIRWRNVYTNDLNLSNEGGANDVDGTWGNFTIQEGEDDLFLINKRNGKKYKFNLTEV